MPEVITDGSVMLLEREIGQIPYYPNQERKFDLKLQPNLIKKITLHVRGKAILPAGSSKLNGRLGMYGFIRNVQIRASNGVILKSIEPSALNLLTTLERGGNEMTIAPVVSFSSAVAQDWAFDLTIPFDNWTGFLPERTILNSNEFSEIGIYIQWGDPSDIPLDDITDLVLILSDVVCDIVLLERVPIDIKDELLNRQRMVDTMQSRPITGDNQSITFDLPENTLIKTLLFYVEWLKQYTPVVEPPICGDYRMPLPNGVLRARVEDNNGAHVIREMSGRQIQSENQSYYGMADMTPRKWTGLFAEHIEVADVWGNQKPGVYCFEFDKMHDFSTLYSTIGINYPKLILSCGVLPVAGADYTYNYRVVLLQRQIITPASVIR